MILILALLNDSYASICYLLDYNIENVNYFCETFVEKILITDKSESLSSNFENYFMDNKIISSQDKAKKESIKVINSLLIIWEFLDRGMKGFLTGDVTFNMMQTARSQLEKAFAELEKIETEFTMMDLDPFDFYESFFKIDHKFYKNNRANNLVLDLSKYFESQGVQYKRLLYFVNLKHTQFFDRFKSKLNIQGLVENSENKLKEEDIKLLLNEKKNKVQQIFNDLYNEVSEKGITNKLKTPFYGIPFPEKENRINMFRRQLLLEEATFERANEDFLEMFSSLQNLDKAHEMFFNKNVVSNWASKLSVAISDYQSLTLDKLEFNVKGNEYMKYFLALPSKEITVICLLHIMKLIINNMALKPDEEKAGSTYLKVLRQIEVDESEFEIEIPLVNFAEDLGKLFFTELRNTKLDHQFENHNAKLYFKNISANLVKYEVSSKDKIRLGVVMTNILIRNLFYENKDEANSQFKVLKMVKKGIGATKYQNFVVIDKDFVSKYYVSAY